MMGIKIIATGSYLPSKVVTNDDLSKIVDTSDEWIVKRTGIRTRHYLGKGETHQTMAEAAAKQALERANIDRSKIAACIVTTLGGDYITPTCACMLQTALGLDENTACFDMNSACAGFPYGLKLAQGLVTKERPYALVVSCEALSRLTDFTDRSTCVLFGDGAGAVVVEGSEDTPDICAVLGSRSNQPVLYIDGSTEEGPSYIHMEGQAVFKFAVDIIPRCIQWILDQAGKTVEDLDWLGRHQANERIIDHAVKKMQMPPEKAFKNIAKYGNMSSACIPIALNDLYEAGQLRSGMRVLCVGFGGGLTWGGCLIEIGGIS